MSGVAGKYLSFLLLAAQGQAQHKLIFGQVEYWLNAAAEVHQAKCQIMNITPEHVFRIVRPERKERHGREIVEDDNGQNDENHLEGPFLHRVHLVSAWPRLPQGPEDSHVAEHHEGEGGQDDDSEHLIKVRDVPLAFASTTSHTPVARMARWRRSFSSVKVIGCSTAM